MVSALTAVADYERLGGNTAVVQELRKAPV